MRVGGPKDLNVEFVHDVGVEILLAKGARRRSGLRASSSDALRMTPIPLLCAGWTLEAREKRRLRRDTFFVVGRMRQKGVEFRHDLEGIGDVEHVRFAASPATIRIEIDGAALIDEAPAHDMRFFAVTAC